MSSFDAVEAQYDTFPYPKPSVIEQQLPAGFSCGILNFLTRRRAEDWLKAPLRIWIAGCGTQQASMWALSYPEAEILATDLSENALDIACTLASQLQIENIRFEKQNIIDAAYKGAFDVVVSTGVIHHMPDPVIGASCLRKALKPNGALILMVYNTLHRAALNPFRAAHKLLSKDGENDDDRFNLAIQILDAVLGSPRCRPAGRDLLAKLREAHGKDRAYVADALLHPLEHTYDVTGLIDLLNGAGLRLTSWFHPAVWDLSHYLNDEHLIERCERLDEADQWQIVQSLAGLHSPLLEVIAERRDKPIRPPYALDELFAMRVVRSNGMQGFGIENEKVTKTGFIPPYEIKDDQLRGRGRGILGQPNNFTVPAVAREVIDAFAKAHPVGEVIKSLSPKFSEQNLIELISRLLPCDIGMLSPLHPI